MPLYARACTACRTDLSLPLSFTTICKQLLKAGVKPEYSILAQAAAWNVLLYTSFPGDLSIGMNVARHALDGNALTLDPLADVNETTAIVHHATDGVIILGGGSPKNFYLYITLIVGGAGHSRLIRLLYSSYYRCSTLGRFVWSDTIGGNLWGKIKPAQLKDAVVVYGDFTITLPLLTAYAVSKARPRFAPESYSLNAKSYSKN